MVPSFDSVPSGLLFFNQIKVPDVKNAQKRSVKFIVGLDNPL
jgi:hypothetical protein